MCPLTTTNQNTICRKQTIETEININKLSAKLEAITQIHAHLHNPRTHTVIPEQMEFHSYTQKHTGHKFKQRWKKLRNFKFGEKQSKWY